MPEYDSDCQRPEFFSGFVSAASLVWSIFGENEYHFLTELHSEIQKAYHLKMWITDLYFTMISMSSMWTCQKRWRIWDFTLYKSQRVIFIDAGRRQRLLGQRQRTSIQSMSIHVHIVFYCPQRPQNNIGRARQLLHRESLCVSWGAEFRGKIQSHGLWCATKPFQTWLLCLLLTCSIIGRHYPYRLRPFTIQVSLTKWFRMKVLSELPRKWEKHGSPRGTVPQQGVGMRRSGILLPQLCLGQDGTETQRRVVSVSWLIE